MVDIAKFNEAKSDQINAADLSGREMVIKIREVRYQPEKDQPLDIFYDGDSGKPWRPSKAAGRIIAHFWGTETDNWIGRLVRLYNDETVKFGNERTGGIRINAMSHIKEKTTVRVPIARMRYKDYTVDVIRGEPQQPAIDAELDQALKVARDVATMGTARLRMHVDSLSKELRARMKPHMADIIDIAKASDAEEVSETSTPDDEGEAYAAL